MKNNDLIDFDKFVTFVHEKSDTGLSEKEVHEILILEEEYDKDSSESLSKSLRLNELRFEGEKKDGSKISYQQEFYSGIHLWLADNLKGKSTIFKIIKYALTGKLGVKKDISKWIKKILLEFQVGDQSYTCVINREGRAKGALYQFKLSTFDELIMTQKLETILEKVVFEFKSDTSFESQMQEFFFKQFNFYNLKYTSKSSGKGDTSLRIVDLSWSTYFNSIYLESKNYNFLYFEQEQYGAQGRKIFEMILGLPLTYPINMLTIQKDRTEEEIGKLEMIDTSNTEKAKKSYSSLKQKHESISKELKTIEKSSNLKFDDASLLEKYNSIFDKLNKIRSQRISISKEADKISWSIRNQSKEIDNFKDDKNKLNKNINILNKRKNDLELYQSAGSFFSNLDIKSCPHCETVVAQEEMEKEKIDHECRLCGSISLEQKIAKEEIDSKLESINNELKETKSKLYDTENSISLKKNELGKLTQKLDQLKNNNQKSDLAKFENQLESIQLKLRESADAKRRISKALKEKERLIREEAVLAYKLEEIETGVLTNNLDELNELKKKLLILEIALDALHKKRHSLNKNIIDQLESLMLEELHLFGLKSVTKVKIDQKFNPIFTQNSEEVVFSDLSEGEMLRAKLCFYLSLIQLDIKHQLGKHPRFLIFDSPGKEEIVPKDLDGLAEIFKDVNTRLGNELQIFVGSALREFETITDQKRSVVKNPEEYMF